MNFFEISHTRKKSFVFTRAERKEKKNHMLNQTGKPTWLYSCPTQYEGLVAREGPWGVWTPQSSHLLRAWVRRRGNLGTWEFGSNDRPVGSIVTNFLWMELGAPSLSASSLWKGIQLAISLLFVVLSTPAYVCQRYGKGNKNNWRGPPH